MKILLMLSLFGMDSDSLMYNAYLNRSVDNWKKVVELKKAAAEADKKNEQLQFDLAFAYFSLLSGTMAIPDDHLFNEYVGDGKDLLEDLMHDHPHSGNYPAMLGNIYGDEIGHAPMKGMLLGSKTNKLVARGKRLEPTSAIVWYVFAVNKYYTPPAFGGSYEDAVEAAMKCVELLESNPQSLKNNWMYLDILALLGNAQRKLERTDAAIEVYNKALSIEPSFEYAKYLLEKVKP